MNKPIRAALLLAICSAFLSFINPAISQTRSIKDQDFDCLVDAHSRVKVSAAVSGMIEAVHVDRGDRVKAGQVLVELEASVERAQLEIARARARNLNMIEAAQAKLENAEKSLDRLTRLRAANPGALTVTQFEEASAQYKIATSGVRDAELAVESARLEADRAEAILNLRKVKSPIDGVVIERLMNAGEYRNEQSSFLTIARIDPLHVEVYLPVRFYGQTGIGGKAEVTLDAPLASRHEATVIVVDRVLDTSSGTFGVRLALPNPDLGIPAGTRCKIRFRQG